MPVTSHAFNFKVPLIVFHLFKRKSSQNLIKYWMGESDRKPQICSHYYYQIFRDSSIRRGGAPVVGEQNKDANRIDRIDLVWSRMFSPRFDDHHKDNRLWHSSLWFFLLVFTPVGKLNSIIMICHWQSYCGCGRMICKLSFETIIEYGNPSLALPPM